MDCWIPSMPPATPKTLLFGSVGVFMWMVGGQIQNGIGDIYMRLITEEALAVVTIMQEAEGEPYAGKLAVAEVIRNRMNKQYASDGTISGTVLRAKQFSGWNATGTKNDPFNLFRVRSVRADNDESIVRDCIRAWNEAKAGSNTVYGAVLYLNPSIVNPLPDWALPDSADAVAIVGKHHFFIPKPRPGTTQV